MKRKLKLTIGMPVYNNASLIGETMKSILSQSFQDFEIIISDDCSTDDTIEVIKKFKDKRIKIYRNKKNLGYGKNLQVLRKLIKGDILFLMGQDDILLKNALLKTYQAFLLGEEIGAVTRPYYWFDEDVRKPIRAVAPYDEKKDRVISIFDGEREVQKIFESVGQLSGLAYRVKYMDTDFHQDIFPAHIYPFASITKKYKIVFLKDYTIAVRISVSMSRTSTRTYRVSPTKSWLKMLNTVYQGDKYQEVKKAAVKQVAANFIGLVQIKNYGTFQYLIREILIMLRLYPLSILNLKFWFFSLGTIFIPRRILIWLVDNYKNKILSKRLKNIKKEGLI
ncbi:glycosyltransferase [Candidatus Microgenomates bacterium]|nr:glycosyltransferase [Candidatus Microgenomates bacterium]